MRYYIEEDTSTTPPTLVKVPVCGSYINYNTAPIGSIQQYSGTSLPPGWLWCNGSAYSRTYFPFLFKVIGTTYGTGDGSTTFNVPTIPDLATGIKYIIKAYSTADAKELGIDAADPQDLPGRWGNIEDWTTTINSITPETDWVAPATGMLTFYPIGVPTGVTSTQLRTCLTEMRNGTRLPAHIWCSTSVDANGFISNNNSAGIIEKGHVYQILNPGAGYSNVYNAMFTPFITDSTEPVDDPPGEVYTTTETKIGTWIDGKPIYRAAFDSGVLTNVDVLNTRDSIKYSALAGKVGTIIDYNANATFNTTVHSNVTRTMPFTELYSNMSLSLWNGFFGKDESTSAVTMSIQMYNANPDMGRLVNARFIGWVEYTKTTD